MTSAIPTPATGVDTTRPQILGLLDWCKGVSILLVVLIHLWGGWFGWQGVHVFIVLSGFGLTYARLQNRHRLPWKEWYSRRLRRILPTYWVMCLVGYGVTVGVQLAQGASLLAALSAPKRLLFFEVTLLKNIAYNTIVTVPNFSLWFVPFILSFYLAFPWIYGQVVRQTSRRGWLWVLAGAVAIEALYRAIAILALDGEPISYSNVEDIWPIAGLPIERLPEYPGFWFQEHAPFGFFPSRLGEFVLGMLVALGLVHDPTGINRRLLQPRAAAWGGFAWVLGNLMPYAGFWGWVMADFVIALGLTLLLVNLAAWCQSHWQSVFTPLSQMGQWSYYIFLTHHPFVYVLKLVWLEQVKANWSRGEGQNWPLVVTEGAVVVAIAVGTALASVMIQRFDRSSWPDRMQQHISQRLP